MNIKISKNYVNTTIILIGILILAVGIYQWNNAIIEKKEKKAEEAINPSLQATEILDISEEEVDVEETDEETIEVEDEEETTEVEDEVDSALEVGLIRFYVFLNEQPLTGALCQAIGEQVYSISSDDGIADISAEIGNYDIIVTYQSFSYIQTISLHDYGRRIEVFWTSTVEPDMGTLIVDAYSDNIPIYASVEVYKEDELITKGPTSDEFDLPVGTYSIYCYYLDFYEGHQNAEVVAGQVTYRTFSWLSDGGAIPLSWLSDMTNIDRSFTMANIYIILGVLIVIVGAMRKK